MLQRQTQTAAFWRDQFEVTPEDMDFLHNLLLDEQKPKTLVELTHVLIQEYIRRENTSIEQELSKGEIYLPKKSYQVGQTLVFPAMNFAVGQVTSVRPGQNPEHGAFEVVSVKLPGHNGAREFAAGLKTPHRLNQIEASRLLDDENLLSADEIYALYKDEIEESLLYALEEGDRSKDFVEADGNWLLADMLADVHVGHLNIAEAMIEMQGRPMATAELLSEAELDETVPRHMRVLSLDHGLGSDPRFDRVQSEGSPKWYLRRLEPAEVVNTPLILRPSSFRYNRALLSVEMLQLEWELDDEWGESSLSSDVPSMVPNTSFSLIYPHRRCGSLPLSGRTRSFFPAARDGRSLVTLIDGRWGTRYAGWVVHDGRYVAGLAKWMDDHALPVGAVITLERTNNPHEVMVDYRTRRAKREWARVATADLNQMRLTFEMNKVQVACEYDEHLIVAEDDPAPIAELRQHLRDAGGDFVQLIEQIMPELTKLSPQGTVHAKSIYSAVNMLRRCPPGPVFYALSSSRRFQDMGGGFFALA